MSGGRFIQRLFLRDDGVVVDDLTDEPISFLPSVKEQTEIGRFVSEYLGEKRAIARIGQDDGKAFAEADKVTSDRDSAAFLQKATLGPALAEIQALTTLGSKKAWVLDQLTKTMARSFCARAYVDYGQTATNVSDADNNASHAYLTAQVEEPPLRMKLVHVLQKFFPISVPGGASENFGRIYFWLSYLDRIDKHVFGNFRDLLESITYSPQMSRMLTYYANRKATGNQQPDENYAREIMQLFTIGLHELNPDGTYKLDAAGNRIPTYTNKDIGELAKCMTGLTRWTFNGIDARYDISTPAGETQFVSFMDVNEFDDMFSNPDRRLVHYLPAYEYGAKYALGGRLNVPEGTDPVTCLSMMHDALFNHPNTAPFFCTRMIQSMVTSNPSPAYVSRVVRAFEDNGVGVRGDLKSVWSAILLDPEANLDGRFAQDFGRVRDGFDLYMNNVRSLDRRNSQGRINANREVIMVGALFTSRFGPTMFSLVPSIFGAYDQLHKPDALLEYGLYAPEAQGWNASLIVAAMTELVFCVTAGERRDTASTAISTSNYAMLPLTGTNAELIERFNLLFCGGKMSPALSANMTSVLASVAAWSTGGAMTTAQQDDRVSVAMQMVFNSPDMWVQL
jgi:uncharacterized protein (DUF1800 family)